MEAARWQRRRLHLLWNPHEDWGLSVIEDWNLSFKKDRAQFMSRKSFLAPFAFLTSNKPSISSLLSKQKWHGASNVNTHTKILLPDWLISSGVSTFFRVFTIFWKWGWKPFHPHFRKFVILLLLLRLGCSRISEYEDGNSFHPHFRKFRTAIFHSQHTVFPPCSRISEKEDGNRFHPPFGKFATFYP